MIFVKATALAGAAAVGRRNGIPELFFGPRPRKSLFGHIHPLSGFLAFDGQELAERALMLAVKEINEAGGIKSMEAAPQLKGC